MDFNPESDTDIPPVQQWHHGHYEYSLLRTSGGEYSLTDIPRQSVYHHGSNNEGHTLEVITPPHSTFTQHYNQQPVVNEFSDTGSRGWDDLEAGRGVYRYRSETVVSEDRGHTSYDHVYPQGGGLAAPVIEPYAQQQAYYFYNQIPVQGPTIYTPDSSTMSFDNNSFTTLTTEYELPSPCSTSISPTSPPSTAIEETFPSTSTHKSSAKDEPSILRCTFSHYVPSRSKTSTKKKPTMACLFCRVRKIACTPPIQGGAETRCNQCVRREIDCQYPKESRRGHYRRLQYLERVGREVVEKIAELERQSVVIPPSQPKKGVRKLVSKPS